MSFLYNDAAPSGLRTCTCGNLRGKKCRQDRQHQPPHGIHSRACGDDRKVRVQQLQRRRRVALLRVQLHRRPQREHPSLQARKEPFLLVSARYNRTRS